MLGALFSDKGLYSWDLIYRGGAPEKELYKFEDEGFFLAFAAF